MSDQLIVANWKSNASQATTTSWCQHVERQFTSQSGRQLVVCPPFPYLHQLGSLPIQLGAQNISAYPPGAYTGEVSGDMLKDHGCRYVLIGHSERRSLFDESADVLKQKLTQAINHQLTPIFCLGESHEQYEANQTESIIKQQLEPFMTINNLDALIAYEPVWAIGTGLAASPEYANSVHGFIKQTLNEDIRVLYGGSIKPQNAESFLSCDDIDGLLVGGASLDPQSIIAIYQA